MVKDELRKLLNQPYRSENWKKITEFVFPNVSYLQKPTDIPFNSDKVEAFKQIGTVRLADGKNLAMFEVHVAENVNLSSNRVELRKLVAPLIDQERNHGVLVIYEQGKEDYRFTFTAKSTEFDEDEGDFINVETDAKRFTYILGKNESCKTAANRFWELSSNKEKATIKDVEQAFSVERLNKEFFDKYKAFYEDFVQHITGKRFEKEKGKWVEKTKGKAIAEHKTVFGSDDKLARNFVKLLLGRLVFIQFLQKKGWMGVPADSKKWENGDKDFTLNFFNACKKQDKFHSDYLYKLFYNAFNTPNRPNDIFELTGTRVPYLNGGLFENEYQKTELINFPPQYFCDLFEFFGQYNFTIDENDPLDHEVGIDPEMLGHIFENLLEDNKDKGAFYTPKPVVQYMCQESLIHYLKTYLKNKSKWPTDEIQSAELLQGLQNFVRKKTTGEIIDYDKDIAKALKEVKICDPAIGSGAFPMGLLNEIFYCMHVLHDANPDTVEHVWQMKSWSPDIVKKNIIQHSIYGVDLEKGAVDIARLRFWLSLIVDEKEPYPLPNLDFKIMQGNSLLESYEGIDLSQIAGAKTQVTEVSVDLFGNPLNAQATIFDTTLIDESNITELIEKYFNAQRPEDKQSLKSQIDSIIHKHIDYNLEFEENKIAIVIADIEYRLKGNRIVAQDSKGIKEKKELTTLKLTALLKKEKDRLKNLQNKRKELYELQGKSERPYFLWHLFFKDVFDKGGFDIVIGNPPYLSAVTMARDNSIKKVFQDKFPLATGSYDMYSLFLLLGIQISNTSGVYSWIIPNKFLIADYAKKIKEELINRNGLINAINVSKFNVFDGVGVYPIILLGAKSTSRQYEELLIDKYQDLQQRIFQRPTELKLFKTFKEFNIQINAGATGFQAKELAKLLSETERNGSIPFCVSGNIDRFTFTNLDVRYMGKKYNEAYISFNKNIVAESKWEFWNSPKIVIAGMTKEVEAVYVKKPLGLGVGVYGIYDFGGFDPYALTAILNSKFLTHYFLNKFKDKHLAGGYLAINKSTIEEFPLIEMDDKDETELSELSKEIHKLKKLKKDTALLEDRINQIVDRLFEHE